MVQGGKNRMFPINNILFCPLCKKRSERWISSGCAFQIKGHENYTYYKESCTKCQKHFYLPCGSNGIIEMRMNGVPIEDAIEAKCNEIKIIPLNQLNPFLLDMVFKNNTDLSVSHVPILS